jgi:phage terminase large subunit-like protein
LMGYVLRDVVMYAYYIVHLWHGCQRELADVQALLDTHGGSFFLWDDLPSDLSRALCTFWQSLHAILCDAHQNFKYGMMATPLLRGFQYKKHIHDTLEELVRIEHGIEIINKKEPIRRFFERKMSIHKWTEPPIEGLASGLDDLSTLIQREPEVKSLVSSYIAYFMSQMSIASICIQELMRYQPWASKLYHYTIEHEQQLLRGYQSRPRSWPDALLAHTFRDYTLAQLADPKDGKFDYPAGKRRNRTNVRAMRRAEENLDKVWTALDVFCKKHAGRTLHDMLDRGIIKGRTIQRTPVWQDPPKTRSGLALSRMPQAEYVYQPFSLLDHDPTTEITGAFSRMDTCMRKKTKTCGTSETQPTQGTIPDQPTQDDPSIALAPQFIVDQHHHLSGSQVTSSVIKYAKSRYDLC